MTERQHLDPRSFRDPDGSLIFAEGRIFRCVTPEAHRRLDRVLSSPVVIEWMRTCKLISTSRAELTTLPPRLPMREGVLYEHPRVPFVSYAHEWSPAQLAAAAVLTLQLATDLLRDGLELKDATPANVLFQGSRPIFVDILSIVPRAEGSYLWLAANQFESTFLLPLIANMQTGIPLSWLSQDTFTGISHLQLARILGMRRFKPSLLACVTIPAVLSSGNRTDNFRVVKQRNDNAAKFILERTYARYLRQIQRLVRPRSSSFWKTYTSSRHHYSDADLKKKFAFVLEAITEFKPTWTLDVGANTGEFSSLAARTSNVVAVEADESSAQAIYHRAQADQLNIQPLVTNFARPSPGLGWQNRESESFLSRASGHFDLVLMLAVIHHLRISAGIPLPAVLDAVWGIGSRYLIVEHIPPTDPMFRRIARGRESLYGDCTEEAFRAEFCRRFSLVRKLRLENGRTLYIGERLPPKSSQRDAI